MSGLKIEKRGSAKPPKRRKQIVTLLSVGLVLLLTQTGRGQEPNTLTFFKNYFVTGDVVAYGVALKGTGSGGFAEADIDIPLDAVPAGAEPVSAFLYWATTVSETALDSGMVGAEFNNEPISEIGKRLSPEGTSPCWSSGGGAGGGPDTGSKRTVYYRADVLRFFPEDTAGNFLINEQTHTVRLPDSGVGNVSRSPWAPAWSCVPGSGARLCGPIQGDFHIRRRLHDLSEQR